MDLLKFFKEVRKLKDIERSGWVERGVKKPESVADHCFITTLMVMVLSSGRKDIDIDKAVRMTLIHDIAESRVGDIMLWTKEISKEEKHSREEEALGKMLKNLDPNQAEQYLSLWTEFEEGKTKEARFVREVDKLEMILQAVDYHKSKRGEKDIEPFFENVEFIKDPELIELIKNIDELKDYVKGR